ncbi:MAG TPA: glycoside hydrolase family 2 TIM barrel-domain containing protein, partial [Tepidisphaeraceae bacterium]|nr:glycoside hydrolase family 2 TIM barrel-domain containing protein [Tepidisphaeraceae bacterium]
QGWWPDGLYTAPTDEALRFDIEMMKKFGFNMCRKHVKVEPDRWYYWADRLGLMVWQDMPSGMERNDGPQFVRDGWPEDAKFNAGESARFRQELEAMMQSLHNHPSIIAWVPFNEGWGQHNCNAVLKWVKKHDPSRLVDGPSGWADRGFGDMLDRHQYPGPGMFPAQRERLSVLGEFGGLGLPVPGHLWQELENWGYRTYQTQEELADQYKKLINKLRPLARHGLCAAIYTQWTDVETEVNGLLTYDRRVIKLDPQALAAMHRKIIDSV